MREIKFRAWDETIGTMIHVTDLNLESKYLVGKIGNNADEPEHIQMTKEELKAWLKEKE